MAANDGPRPINVFVTAESPVEDAVKRAYICGFHDGVRHSAVLFKRLFKRVQRAQGIGELQLILKEMDDD